MSTATAWFLLSQQLCHWQPHSLTPDTSYKETTQIYRGHMVHLSTQATPKLVPDAFPFDLLNVHLYDPPGYLTLAPFSSRGASATFEADHTYVTGEFPLPSYYRSDFPPSIRGWALFSFSLVVALVAPVWNWSQSTCLYHGLRLLCTLNIRFLVFCCSKQPTSSRPNDISIDTVNTCWYQSLMILKSYNYIEVVLALLGKLLL
jgi:hypothetical protein